MFIPLRCGVAPGDTFHSTSNRNESRTPGIDSFGWVLCACPVQPNRRFVFVSVRRITSSLDLSEFVLSVIDELPRLSFAVVSELGRISGMRAGALPFGVSLKESNGATERCMGLDRQRLRFDV